MKSARPRRAYDNRKRSAAAARTRESLVDAALEVLASDPDGLSLPAVARRAGVSAQTAYRHFPTQEQLEDAVLDRYRDALHARVVEPPPGDRAAWRAAIRHMYENYGALDPALRALSTSRLARQGRIRRRGQDRGWLVAYLGPGLDHVEPADAEAALDVMAALCTTGAARLFEEYLGLGPEAAADRVAWLLERLGEWADRHRPEPRSEVSP